MISIRAVSTFTNPGARPIQEDHVLASRERGVFVVADGFGGPGAGQEAASRACEAVQAFLHKEAHDLDATMPFVLRSYFSLAGNVLFNALVHANRKIMSFNQKKSVNERGGASVIAGFLDGDLLALANVGACQAWLIRDGRAAELVIPRTYARLIEPFADARLTDRDIPLMALGMGEDIEPEIFEYRVQAGDWLILHTDGLSPSGRQALLGLQAELPKDGKVPGNLLDQVEARVQEASGQDNISLSLVIF